MWPKRLETSIRDELDRLRKLKEVNCSDIIAIKLKQMGSATIDRLLRHEKEIERIRRKYYRKRNPLLYQKIPVKVFQEQDRSITGNIQIDLVEHCGSSASGEFINTLSTTDISSGWWEGEAIMGKGQERTFQGLQRTRNRYPFSWKEIHSDNGTEFINYHLLEYTSKESINFTRSRPYKKNDNCLIEQKNWTHVKKFIGYSRYETEEELNILNDLYRNELRLYKNFFQPIIKLKSKERIMGKIHRKYDKAKTPYRKLLESGEITQEDKEKLETIYNSLNPVLLKKTIDDKLRKLYEIRKKVDVKKKVSVRFSTTQSKSVSVR